MPRYNPYGNRQMQPEQYDTGSVPYISYDSPDKEKLMTEILDRGQQRYDLTQSVIGKYLEENAKGDFSDKDYAPVTTALNNRLEKIKQTVKDKYQGEYSSAANEILQELGKARNIFFQAEAEKKKEDKYGPLLDKMKSEKKLLWEPGKGDPRERAAFDQNGNYVPRDYSGFVEKSDYDKMIAEDFVKGIDKKSIEGGLGNSNIDGILQSVTRQGLAVFGDTPEQQNAGVDKLVDAYLPVFKQNSTVKLDSEFKDDNDIKNYIKKTVFGMASNVVSRQNIGDPNFDKTKGTTDPKLKIHPAGVIYEGGLANNPNSFTLQTFFKNSPNARHTVSKQFDEPLKEVTSSIEDYSKGNINLEQYQSFAIETKLRNSDPKLQELWKVGSRKDEDLVKETFDTAKKEGKNYDPRVVESLAKGKIDSRNKAAKEYSELLEKKVSEYISTNGTDLDYQIEFYQPDFSQDKVATAYNNFNTNIEAGYTNPGQFDFLDDTGGMKGKSADKKNKAYDSKKKFAVMGVGGNDVTGLIWKVKNPDGTISNAKWNTGYKKQLGAITDIYGSPEMVNVLNSSALDIRGNKIVTTFPDTPKNIEGNIRKYKMSAEVNVDNPNLNYIKSGDSYISIDTSSGSPVITTVSSKEKATPLPKNLIFDILNSLQ